MTLPADATAADLSPPAARADEDIAIVGMACFLPGADGPRRYWQNIVGKVDCVGEPTPDWQPEFFAPHVYVRRGGFLGEIARFNPARYGIMPSSIEGAEPDQFLAFRCAVEALHDAGYPEIPINRPKTGVILGRGIFINRGLLTMISQGYMIGQFVDLLRQLEPERTADDLALIERELRKRMPPFNSETVPGLTHNILAGRVANRLDLNGPAYTVDAACSSALLAVDQSIRELRSGRCDMVLAGGVQVSTPGMVHMAFCYLDALSKQGKIAPFSAEASGTLLGQGCGVLVLKRRSDAERDGNRIYALVKGVGTSSDGKGSGLLAPSQAGQEIALRQAYGTTGVDPATIGLVEAHGTGIPLGDQTEIKTLTSVFGARHGAKPTVAVGSVKSMISHLIPASGAASLIKTALALYHRVLPPMLHAEQPNPALGLERTPFYLSTTTRPWIHGERRHPRRAGVNAFGFGGINTHAILEEHLPAAESDLPRLEDNWPVELVVVSAESREALCTRLGQLRVWLERAPHVRLLDVAASTAAESGALRVAIVAQSVADLLKKLVTAEKMLSDPAREKIQDRSGIFWYAQPLAAAGRVAFVFPGEGAQYPNMLADLCRHFPEVRREFDLTDAAFLRTPGRQPLSRLIYPLPDETQAAEAELLELGGAVTSVTLASRALLALLRTLAIEPQAIVGHSSGEFGALMAAGAIAPEGDEALIDALSEGANNAARLSSSGLVPPAVLLAVGGAERAAVDAVVEHAAGRLTIAMDNCPSQVILSGDEAAVDAAIEGLRGKGGLCEKLPWGRAYHTAAFEPASGIIEDYFRTIGLQSPRVETWSCASVERFPAEPPGVQELAVRQWRSPVRFRETVEAMYAAGVRIFLEVGPRGNLAAFVSDTLKKQPHLSVALDVPRYDGVTQLCRALGQLVAHGVPLNLDALYRRRQPQRLDLAAEPPAAPKTDPVLRLDLPTFALSDETLATLRQSKPDVNTASAMPSAPAATSAPSTAAVSASPASHAAAAPPLPRAATPVKPAPALPTGTPTVAASATYANGHASAATPRSPATPSQPAVAASAAIDPRTQAVVDYQRTMRHFVEMQQRIMSTRLQGRQPASTHNGVAAPGSVAANPAAVKPAPVVSASVVPAATPPAVSAVAAPATRPTPPVVAPVVHAPAPAPPPAAPLAATQNGHTAAATQAIAVTRASASSPAPREAAKAPGSPPPASSAPATGTATLPRTQRSTLPLLETVLIHEPGSRLLAECELDIERHRFLLDHTFLGRALSTVDSNLQGLPVMPLAMSLELMAEAAAKLCPDLTVVAMDNVRTMRWLAFETSNRRVRMEARQLDETHVHVTVSEADREGFSAVIVEGNVELGEFEPELGPAVVPDRATEPAPWAENLYDWILFHGPAFQGIDSIDAYEPTAIRATVHEPDAGLLFAPGAGGPLVLPSALVDVASQVPGMIYGQWHPEDPEVYMVFPNSIGRLEFVADRPKAALTAVATMHREGALLHSDVELKAPDGRIVLRMTGRVCQVVDFPTGLHHYSKASTRVTCSRDITEVFAGVPHIEACRVCETLTAGSPILLNRLWSQVVARMILDRQERAAFAGQKLSPAAAAYWLAGRIAAKDAVRLFAGAPICMADVAITANGDGKPHAHLPGDLAAPAVSIAHKEFKAVALAAPAQLAAVGIDIEALIAMDPGLVADAFTPEELALLAAAATASQEPVDNWYLSAWSAKEALGKALGRGVLGGPRAVEVRQACATTGRFLLALRGPMAEAFPKLTSNEAGEICLPAYRRLHGPYCVAICLLESLPA
ncbi:MAG: polyketide synthase dehydratase domain-containing protein [Pirellulales bacterium]|nr:polyketide synthase dehydratase domain-containing protein [Pirellulales bacterium]